MSRRKFLILLGAAAVSACAPPLHTPPGFMEGLDAPYTLASGDRLRIIVFGQDNLSNSYAVDGSGRVSLPLIGPTPAGGMTTTQLERAIEAKLRNGYLREPRVSVEVEQYRPFFVLGEVTTAGQFPYVNAMTVQTAIAIAGGFSPRALRTQADITRQIGGRPVSATVPITFPVRPGDTIVVRERWF
ncbi:sugar ABC transporter substrate-binding protein [Alsobacter metallidurans]|uniref:Sugar ABC transporter substrate-binding protein n=1 Tax=Alsobacter metallidurans TaxID=340221 RepID=A0A917MI46_9HYPH|nr:polysaccharide biosynthesis/export family protein [Alsobacter metallidurans]GGH21432.1 sugar ABC transporter substrate-binding protein [Alsobacter metallidurans]